MVFVGIYLKFCYVISL